jgi:hypothetical protein
MIAHPRISVVLPVYNGEAHLEEAITSVLDQSLGDFEFIIVDDGSSDGTASILERYERKDPRIRVLEQDNSGLISALNRGCRLASAKYIARMDADDVCLPQRFARQWEYLEEHPQVGIVGTWIRNIKDGAAANDWRPPTRSKVLQWTHFFGVCVSHPTVLMRRELLERLEFYRPGAMHVEDVDLWLRASAITEFGNVPEVLLKYRALQGSVTHAHRQFAAESHVRLLTPFIGDFLQMTPAMEAVAGLRQTRVGPPPDSLPQIQLTADLIVKLYERFSRKHLLAAEDRCQISWDAAKRVASLAVQASRFDTRAAGSLLMQALKLNPRVLLPAPMLKGLRRAIAQRMCTGPVN